MFDTKWDEADAAIFPVEVEPDKEAAIKKCSRCRGYRNKNGPSHTRVAGECRWPFAASIHWECAACQAKEPFRLGNHTLEIGECKFASRTGRVRAGGHPRARGTKVQESPASDP